MNLKREVEHLTKRGLSARTIAVRLGVDVQRVHEYRSKQKKPDHYKAVQTARRRRLGQRPRAEIRAETARREEERLTKIRPLIARMTWGEAANKLGITKNTIAGLVHRARQREKARAAA